MAVPRRVAKAGICAAREGIRVYVLAVARSTLVIMRELAIHISWEYFLGLIGTLIGIAYYANGGLTRLETSMEWVKNALRHLTANLDGESPNRRRPTHAKKDGMKI